MDASVIAQVRKFISLHAWAADALAWTFMGLTTTLVAAGCFWLSEHFSSYVMPFALIAVFWTMGAVVMLGVSLLKGAWYWWTVRPPDIVYRHLEAFRISAALFALLCAIGLLCVERTRALGLLLLLPSVAASFLTWSDAQAAKRLVLQTTSSHRLSTTVTKPSGSGDHAERSVRTAEAFVRNLSRNVLESRGSAENVATVRSHLTEQVDMKKTRVYVALSVLLVSWLALTLSGWGLLYLAEQNNDTNGNPSQLTCHYFMGTRTFVWTHGFSGNGTCPTWQNPVSDRKPR